MNVVHLLKNKVSNVKVTCSMHSNCPGLHCSVSDFWADLPILMVKRNEAIISSDEHVDNNGMLITNL